MRASFARREVRLPIVVAASILLLAHGGPRSVDAQTMGKRLPPRSAVASIAVGDGWLDVRFPPLALSELGCRGSSPGDTIQFTWGVFQNFADAQPPHGHNMTLIAWFRLPSAPPLTEAHLDSALALAKFELFEHPRAFAPDERELKMRNAWVRREGDRIHLRVENDSVVAAFMRPRADRGILQWCQRDDAEHAIVAVPIDRH